MSKILSKNPWISYYKPRTSAQIRLFCFHYGGGSASIFSKWQQDMPNYIEICPVQLPGRENRLEEPLYKNLVPIIEDLENDVFINQGKSFAFFGHSIGALICFELARSFRKHKLNMPFHIFVSGLAAPQFLKFSKPLFNLPEREFINELKNLFNPPNEIFEEQDLKELFLPIIKADFSIRDTYVYKSEPPLDCPITVFGGLQDSSTKKDWLEGWSELTTGKFSIYMFPGEHFFLNTSRLELLNKILEKISKQN